MEIKSGQGERWRVVEVDRPVVKKGEIINYRFKNGSWRKGRLVKIGDACNNKPEHKTTRANMSDNSYPYVLYLKEVE
jgi:hypothetical protein